MSTRFVIARPHPTEQVRWTGVYGHSDGYPTEAGKHLFTHVVTRFNGDPEEAAKHFIDAHPCGWSFLSAEFSESECYCHDRGEPDAIATETETDAGAMDWTYVLRAKGMEVRRWGRFVTVVPWDAQVSDKDWELVQGKGYATT